MRRALARPTRRTILTTALAMVATPALARFPNAVPDGLIFFVGNSFTRQHDIPSLVCRIAAQAGVPAHCHRHTNNGARLYWSLDFAQGITRDRGGPVPATVVLQDHSTEALVAETRDRSADAMATYSAQFTRTVLFETWPRRAGHPLYDKDGMPDGPEQMADLTHRHYARQAARLGATHAQVGVAWMAAIAEGVDPYAYDGYHANAAGAWLAALVLARALGLPDAADAAPPATIDPGVAATLARVAARTP